MTREEAYGRLDKVFQDVFDDESIHVTDATTSNDIEDWDSFEHINLIDYTTGIVTDLLQSSYTFSTERTQNDARFALNVVPRQETPTGLENGANGANDANGVRKLIINDKLFIIRDGVMYDATGKKVREINK